MDVPELNKLVCHPRLEATEAVVKQWLQANLGLLEPGMVGTDNPRENGNGPAFCVPTSQLICAGSDGVHWTGVGSFDRDCLSDEDRWTRRAADSHEESAIHRRRQLPLS